MPSSSKADPLIPVGLILLSLVPAIAGTVRLRELAEGGPVTPENARFFAAPLLITAHLAGSLLYSLVGALQFSPGFRRRNLGWHRLAGRALIPLGLLAALSGVWLGLFHAPVATFEGTLPTNYDGRALQAIRVVVGSAMIVSLWLGYTAVRRRDIARHRAWMIRAYALGLGAGTQVFTHLPWFLFPAFHGELSRTVFMGAGWALNAILAEWLIARGRPRAGVRVAAAVAAPST